MGTLPELHPGTQLTCRGLQMTRSVVTPPATRARPGPSLRVRHPDRGDPRRPGDPVPEEATAQSAGHGLGHGVSPPVLSFSGFLRFAGLTAPRVGTRERLERAQDAGPRGGRRGARTEPPRVLPSLPPRTAQAGWAGGGVAFPGAWMWAWRRVSRAREPPSFRPEP